MTDQLLKHVFSLNFANASFIDGTGVLETKKEHIERLEIKRITLEPNLKVHYAFIYDFLFFFRDFLPRGSGIVTRRPLVLQLVTSKAGN